MSWYPCCHHDEITCILGTSTTVLEPTRAITDSSFRAFRHFDTAFFRCSVGIVTDTMPYPSSLTNKTYTCCKLSATYFCYLQYIVIYPTLVPLLI